MKIKLLIKAASLVGLVSIASGVMAAPINQVLYGSLTGTEVITFDDVAGGSAPGTNYDSIFESGNTAFAERFVGQSNTPSGDFDVLSGSPSGPLALAVGARGQNLNIVDNSGSQVLAGLGPTGFPNFSSIGEGSIALLFDFDQSEFGFQLLGGNAGNAFLSFFKRDGSLIQNVTLSGLADAFYGFSRDGGIKDVAGVSIYTDDGAGIGFDNLKHDVAGIPNMPVSVPATLGLFGLGIAGLGWARRKA